MIREFLSKRRLVFFPKGWANSIVQWICGVHSPSGTVKIVNTANPARGKSASFDVDIEAVWAKLKDRVSEMVGRRGEKTQDNPALEERNDGGDNPQDYTTAGGFPDDEIDDRPTGQVLWESGGETGCKLHVLFEGKPYSDTIDHRFYEAIVTFDAKGRALKVESVAKGGMVVYSP